MSTSSLRSAVLVGLLAIGGCTGSEDTRELVVSADSYDASPEESFLRSVRFEAVSLNGEPVSTGDPVHDVYLVRFSELRQSDGRVVVHVVASSTRREGELFFPNCAVQPSGVLTENEDGRWFVDESAIIESPSGLLPCDPLAPAVDVIPIFESEFDVKGDSEGLVLTTDAGDVVALELVQTSSDFVAGR